LSAASSGQSQEAAPVAATHAQDGQQQSSAGGRGRVNPQAGRETLYDKLCKYVLIIIQKSTQKYFCDILLLFVTVVQL